MKPILIALLCVLFDTSNALAESSLRGTKAAVKNAYEQALTHDFSFLDSEQQQARFLELGLLVKLGGNQHYAVDDDVSRPYVRTEVQLFVERLSRQFYASCGKKLVVTSALRFVSERPRNGSLESVHPTGMAVDFRSHVCHDWLKRNLLITEDRNITEATLERNPPHFHVVIFPKEYRCYVAKRTGGTCQSEKVTASTKAVLKSPRPLTRPLLTSLRPVPRPETAP